MGSAIAFFLSQSQPGPRITVVERDFAYTRASSALSASSIRQQFSTAINIQISQFGIDFLRALPTQLGLGDACPAIGLHEGGYLYLARPGAGEQVLRDNHAQQTRLGVDVALLDAQALGRRFPWLATSDLALGSLGLSGEGWFDGYSLLQAFRQAAQARGVRYLQAEAVGVDVVSHDGVAHVQALRLADGSHLPCTTLVNAAGPWAREVATWVGIDLPVRARRRTVFHVSCPQPLPGCPLLIDTSGIWLRPEGSGFITGFAPEAAHDLDDLPLEPEHEAFETHVWPTLAERIPAFEALKVRSAWAGYYEMNTVDHNAIVGLHPACDNLVFANGFSGHGLQQSPAVGRGVAELIAHGQYQSLDLAPVGWARILQGRPLLERNVI